MAQIKKGQTFADGDLVTYLKLNNIVDLASLNPEAITDQHSLDTSFDIQSTDLVLLYDQSEYDLTKKLKKVSIDDIMRSGQVVKFQSISAVSGSDLTISIGGGNFFVVNGNTSISGNLVGTGLVQGYTGKFQSELTIPSGTTGTRPASPIVGSVRFNTDTGVTEIYSGSAWVNGDITASNNTFSGTNTFSNTVNVTGAVQYNGVAVYGLYAITEETIPNVSGSGVVWTSSSFTKPSDEIWVFEIDTFSTFGTGNNYISFLNTSGVAYNGFGVQGAVSGITIKSSWVVNAGTALSVETLRISSNNSCVIASTSLSSAANKFRIYKYRTA